jgi:1-acyl-sn-glycerol-3-phosphate acyltransferase
MESISIRDQTKHAFQVRDTFVVSINLLRIALSWLWTFLVGLPLLAVIYTRYGYGLLRARLGRPEALDSALEANAHLAGWVAQRLWTSVLFAVLNVPVRVRERARIEWSKAHVICSNHASLLDILALVRAVPPPYRFVAKRELMRWPIVGWALRPAGQIVVDRGDHAQAVKTIAEAAVRKIRGQVIFFVEGTRSRTGKLQPFKKGAFHFAIHNQLPILPVAVRGSFEALAKLPWWKLRAGLPIEVCFCPPIAAPSCTTAQDDEAKVHALCDETRAVIAKALGRD